MKNFNKQFVRWGRRYLVLWWYAYCKTNELWIEWLSMFCAGG